MRWRMWCASVVLFVCVVAAGRIAGAQVTDPEQWIGDWTGVVTSQSSPDCDPDRPYVTETKRVRFRVTAGTDGRLLVTAAGVGMPWLLSEGEYAARTDGDGLLVNDEAPLTVRLSREGVKLRYTAVADTRCGGVEKGLLSRRTSSGVVDCDNLVGLHIAATSCPGFQDAASGYHDLRAVAKLRGRARVVKVQQCRKDLATLRTSMRQADCPGFGAAAQVRPAPTVGFLVASTTPWASLAIDGQPTGRMTPITAAAAFSVPVGRRTLTFTVGDRTHSFQVDIEPGQTLTFNADLTGNLPRHTTTP